MNMAINRRNMRILLILILSIFSFMFCFSKSNLDNAFAESSYTPKVEVESKTVHRGQTFSIDVELSENEGLTSMFLSLDYDNEVMTLTNVIQGNALGSLTMTLTNVETEEGYSIKPFNILWDGRNSDKTNGTILTFIFDSNIDATIGDYPITLTYDKQNTNTAYQTPTDLLITNGVVTLISGEYQAVYRDYSGDVLYEKDYNDNDLPSYPNTYAEPFRVADDEYIYEFIGWKGVPSEDTNTLIFEADYKAIPKVYTIFFYIDGYEKNGVTNYPDGIIDETEDFFYVKEVPYGTYIETPDVPLRQYYQFYGWYADRNFTTVSTYGTMPSKNISLYGYYSFDVRDKDIPIISLENVDIKDNLEDVVVTAKILKNTGFNGLVLTLKYDREAFVFDHFEKAEVLSSMQFDTTNTEDMGIDNFKFYYEAAENNNETGDFLILYFKLKPGIEENTYKIWFEYDYHTDATYVTTEKELKYTMIEFIDGEVPVGEIDHWVQNLAGDRFVDVSSATGKPINVYLEVELVTSQITIDEDLIKSQVGSDMYLSSAYQIRLMQNKREIQPNTTLTIRIKLTENEQKGNIKFYYLNDNYELVSYDFKIENGELLVFATDHLSNWVIFSDYVKGGNNGYNNPNLIFGSRGNAVYLMGMPLLLAIATMLYALRLRQKITKLKKEAHND